MCSINLSGQGLGDDKFLRYVIAQFHRSGIDGSGDDNYLPHVRQLLKAA